MQLSDIDILIKPNVYTYFGYAFIQTLVEYEYQFEWDLRNSDGLPQQLFAGLRVNVNAGARNVIGSQLVVNGFENDLGPQKCELGVSSPCNMQNGNFYYQQTDYAHAGSHLYFQRHYNSLQEVTSAVTGGDWASTGGSRVIDLSFLINNGKKLFLYLDEQGRYEYFYEQDDGSLQADSDVDLHFFVSAAGYTIASPTGQVWYHDSAGKLESMSDASGNITQYLYENNKLSEIKGPFGHSLLLTYNGNNKLSTVQTPDGQQITYEYDGAGLLSNVIWPNGRNESYLYNSQGDMIDITRNDYDVAQQNSYDEFGRVVSHENLETNELLTLTYETIIKEGVTTAKKLSDYEVQSEAIDEQGNHWSVKSGYSEGEQIMTGYQHQSGDDSYTKAYDANGNISTLVDPQNNKTQYIYNDNDQLLTKTLGKGTTEKQVFTYRYINDEIDLLTNVTRKSTAPTIIVQEHNIDMFYTAQYQLQSVIEHGYDINGQSLDRTREITYDTRGRVLSVDGFASGSDDITQLTYHDCDTGNECGQLASITNAVGEQTQFSEYDAAGRITQIIQPNNTVVSTSYNVSGEVVSTTVSSEGIERTTSYEYNQGLLTKTTLPNGETYTLSYDDDQKITGITDALGNQKTFTYDERDNVIKEQLLDGSAEIYYQLTRTVDRLDQINSVASINGVTTHQVNNIGELTQSTDALAQSDSYQYDSLSRLISHTDALSNRTYYDYNNHDQVTSVTDALGSTTAYQYDDFGRVTQQDSPATGISSYQYDDADNMLSSTDARGITANYQYDAANRVTNITYPDADENISYSYNNMGLPSLVSYGGDQSSSNQSQYSYNGFNELITQTDTLNGQTIELAYQYTLSGNISQITYPSGRVIDYHYNAIGNVDQVTTTIDGTTQTLADNISYLPFGGITHLTYGNGKTLTQSYNLSYQLTDKTVDGVLDKTYHYNAVDNINAIDDNLNTDDSEQFSYSEVKRLTDATGNYGELNFDYDGIGNRLSKTKNTDTHSQSDNYSYQDNTLLTTVENTNTVTTMSYDEMGNLTSKGDDSFTYNNKGRLNRATVNNVTTGYRYNHLGQRVIKTFANGDSRYYIYDQQGMLIAELNNDGETQVEYVYLNGQRIALLMTHTSTVTTSGQNQFYIVNLANGLKLKADNANSGSDIRLADASDETDWVKFTRHSAGKVSSYWKNVKSGLYFRPLVDILASNTNPDANAKLEQRPTVFNGTRTQWHRLSAGSNGEVYIKNRWSQDYLQAPNAVAGDKAQMRQTRTDPSAKWTFVKVENVTETVTSTEVYYVHTNHLDAPLALTDDNGTIAWQASLTPFGEINITTDNLPESFTARFPGQYSDSETGFYYNYFRDYDPELGRYIQSDPIGLAGGINTYGYVGGDPVGNVDPLGLWPSQHGFYVHQDVLLYVVKDKVETRFFNALINGQEYADSNPFQTGESSFRHAMTNKGQSKCQAIQYADSFVRNQFALAQKYKSSGTDFGMSRALFHFSVAVHTLQDATSPAHSGFQQWSDSPSYADLVGHVLFETVFSQTNNPSTQALIEITNQAWNWFENGKLPSKNLFLENMGTKCGCN